MRRLAAVLVIATLSIVYVACNRVVDLTSDASNSGVADAVNAEDDSQTQPDAAPDSGPDASPDAAIPDAP